MAEHSLLPAMSEFLDPQLVYALLFFVESQGLYKEQDVLGAQLMVLGHTNMVEFYMETYSKVHSGEKAPQEVEDRRDSVNMRMQELQQKAQPLIDIILDEDNIKRLRGDRTLNSAFLKETFNMGPEQVDMVYDYAKGLYECGDYVASRELLDQYSTYSVNISKIISSFWGKLACEILTAEYTDAHETLNRLREAIDTHLFNEPLKQLQERTWLLHWSLFVYWNIPEGSSQLLDLFLQDRFTIALQVNAPHLLRYLVAAHLIMKAKASTSSNKWKSQLSAITKIIVSEEYHYTDPITDFVKAVYCDYDFDRAQEQLKKCSVLMDLDYFLTEKKDIFMEQARMAIFEVFCRIHQCINLDALAKQIGMDREAAELWIANLIRNAELKARIDSAAGTIVMDRSHLDPLDSIIEKTNNLSVRTFKVANAIIDASQRPAQAVS